MELEELRQLMRARGNVYGLLRCFFLQEPAAEFLVALREQNFLNSLRGYDPDLDEGIRLLAAVISPPPSSAPIHEMAAEFTRLFSGPRSIPLCESLYLPGANPNTPPPALAVSRKFLEAGLLVDPTASFPADHIGAELEFVFYLCQKGTLARTWREGEVVMERQQAFFREHLAAFAPLLCDRLSAEASSPYFHGAAKMVKGFILWDSREIVDRFFEPD